MRGLDDIKAGIKEKYGKFEILGHGESRNGFLVNHINLISLRLLIKN